MKWRHSELKKREQILHQKKDGATPNQELNHLLSTCGAPDDKILSISSINENDSEDEDYSDENEFEDKDDVAEASGNTQSSPNSSQSSNNVIKDKSP